jgi:hypothetical protein
LKRDRSVDGKKRGESTPDSGLKNVKSVERFVSRLATARNNKEDMVKEQKS